MVSVIHRTQTPSLHLFLAPHLVVAKSMATWFLTPSQWLPSPSKCPLATLPDLALFPFFLPSQPSSASEASLCHC